METEPIKLKCNNQGNTINSRKKHNNPYKYEYIKIETVVQIEEHRNKRKSNK